MEEVATTAKGETVRTLRGAGISQAAAAAVFVKYGYDRDARMPYEVFINALLASPSRLLGMEPIMDARVLDHHGYEEHDDYSFDGKIIYPKCTVGVFPPSEFDPEHVVRSSKAPNAELELEHVYGYAGVETTAPNLFYLRSGEIVYYTAAVGIVLDKDKLEKKLPCQRFFFGHDDDIKSIAVHPNREWVATGQLGRRPYVCVWDSTTCLQLQRIDHPSGMRGVIALGFSEHDDGQHITAVNSDNNHTVMVWRWSKQGDAAALTRAKHVPGWAFGPAKRMRNLDFYTEGGVKKKKLAATAQPSDAILASAHGGDPLPQKTRKGSKGPGGGGGGEGVGESGGGGGSEAAGDSWKVGPDGSYELVGEGGGMNGSPPMVYGCVWNPFPGMEEFITYGVKHVKVWRRADGGQWIGETGRRNDRQRVADVSAKDLGSSSTAADGASSASARGATTTTTKPTPVSVGGDDVLAAVYVRENIIITGFPGGALGVWFVSRENGAGAASVVKWNATLIQRIADAHHAGPRANPGDSAAAFRGVRCLCLRSDGRTLLSGGSDGWIHTWEVADGSIAVKGQAGTSAARPTKRAAVALRKLAAAGERNGPHSFQVSSPYDNKRPPAFLALDCRLPVSPDDPPPMEFVMGTDHCDVWEVEYKKGASQPPEVSVQVYGHIADLYAVATHPTDPNVFATSAEADRVFLWNAADLSLTRTSTTGVVGRSIAFSAEPVPASAKHFPGWTPVTTGPKPTPASAGHHIAVGGKYGRVAVMDGVTLQPLAKLKDARSAVDDVKYCGGPRQMLAVGSHDTVIDVYDVEKGYVHLSRCRGHQATVTHLDWSLPLYGPDGAPFGGGGGGKAAPQRLLRSNCASYEILHWDPITGRQVLINQRDTQWESFTCVLGFPVMGVWPDGSDGTDINEVDRAKCGQTRVEDVARPLATLARHPAPRTCASLEGAGFVVTVDDFGKVKLFNYPCVFNDAPYREYKGHASHTMCIRFTSDDARVITVGGHDRAVMQFKTVGIRADEKPREAPPPPVHNRRWGPVGDGKAYGWIEGKTDGAAREPPKAMPSIKLPGSS